MKYIRTKNGIYEVVKADDLETGNFTQVAPSLVYKGRYFSIMENGLGDCNTVSLNESIIKEADTIEELCDEFIVECFNGSYHAISEISYDELKLNTQTLSPNDTIYGAIWTSKGLIYVAKMDDKGDLELI